MAHLKIITGPMFSGKTEELIRILKRSEIAGKKILVLKPAIDSRTAAEIAARHKPDLSANSFKKSTSFPAIPVANIQTARELIAQYQPDVLGIDEAQFFDPWMFDLVHELLTTHAEKDLRIIGAGLDMDAWGRPFGIMPNLMAISDEVQKETAVCFICRTRPAVISQKLKAGNQVEVGDAEIYEARCRVCFTSPSQGIF